MRVLVSCSLGGAGHFNPLRPFLDTLVSEGDKVLVVVPPSLKAMASAFPLKVGGEPPADELAPVRDAIATRPRAIAAVFSERELFGRLCTSAMLPAMEAAFAEWQPELVLREPCEYAAAILAARHGVAQAQIAISQSEVEASALETASPVLEAFESGIAGQIRSSPYLTRFPASLDPESYADTRRYREPHDRRARLANWWPGDLRPLAYMTFGSVAGGMPIAPEVYKLALEVARVLPSRVLLTVGHRTNMTRLGLIPPNVRVEAWVPQDDVFAEASLVINHGGSGTVFGALAAGLPQVIVPLFADHLRNAHRLEGAGAGLCVEIRPDNTEGRNIDMNAAARIAEAATTVLSDAAYTSAARTIGQEMARLLSTGEVLAVLRDEVALKGRPCS